MNQDQQKESLLSQLDKVRKKNIIRIAITDDKAYWVSDNIFYETDVVDGYVDNENARPIDAHKLSKKEVQNLLDILDGINNS